MCECDYIISHIITGAESLALIDGNCHKGCNQIVMGRSVKLKHSIDDQTIMDNCQISKTKIGTLKASMAAIWSSQLEQVRQTQDVIIPPVGSLGAAYLHLHCFLEFLLSVCSTDSDSDSNSHSHHLHDIGEALHFPKDLTSFWRFSSSVLSSDCLVSAFWQQFLSVIIF